jgi:hypothetical protein
MNNINISMITENKRLSKEDNNKTNKALTLSLLIAPTKLERDRPEVLGGAK